jgi:hypothetical protein
MNWNFLRLAARYAILSMFAFYFYATQNYGLLLGALAVTLDEFLQSNAPPTHRP